MPRKNSTLPVRANSTRPKPHRDDNGNGNATSKAKDNGNGSHSSVQIELCGQDVHLICETRQYRVRGLQQNLSAQQLLVNILARRGELVHVDTLDLCRANARAAFIKATATELYVEEQTIKRDVGRLLLELETLQQDWIAAATHSATQVVEITGVARREALDLLHDPQLAQRILCDYEACGLVGEDSNKLVCYLACVSRLLAQPLAVLIQSGSAAGKTALLDATLGFVPPEHQLRYSALTGQSLYYMGSLDLKHKVLAIAEEAGLAQASYALKLLQSDGRLCIAATGKTPGSSRQQTQTYEVQGPVMMLLTTTCAQPDAELENRCLRLQVNESPEQTRAIQQQQRAAYTLQCQGVSARRDQIRERHQNAQRLLEPLPVLIPWAAELRFRHDQTRMRREHAKYLALIAAAALLHQYQRPRQETQGVSYVLATRDDLALANRLLSAVMGQSLDGLLPQTRQLLERICDYVRSRAQCQQKPAALVRFTQRELRETLGWSDFALRRHLARLLELEYLIAHRSAASGNQRYYELLYEGQGQHGEPFLLGLVNPDQLCDG